MKNRSDSQDVEDLKTNIVIEREAAEEVSHNYIML